MLSEVNKPGCVPGSRIHMWASLSPAVRAGVPGAGEQGKVLGSVQHRRGAKRGGHIGKAVVWFSLWSMGQNIKQKAPGSGSECQDLPRARTYPVPWTWVALDVFLRP